MIRMIPHAPACHAWPIAGASGKQCPCTTGTIPTWVPLLIPCPGLHQPQSTTSPATPQLGDLELAAGDAAVTRHTPTLPLQAPHTQGQRATAHKWPTATCQTRLDAPCRALQASTARRLAGAAGRGAFAAGLEGLEHLLHLCHAAAAAAGQLLHGFGDVRAGGCIARCCLLLLLLELLHLQWPARWCRTCQELQLLR
jgi:hypothetical protein